jgi:hypothetical protein
MKWQSLALCLLFSSCFLDERTAGGGSDQPNEIAGTLRLDNGSPMVNSKVVLYRMVDTTGAKSYKPVDSTYTDASGHYLAQGDTRGQYRLYALSRDSSTVAVSNIVFADTTGTDTVQLNATAETASIVSANAPVGTRVQVDTLPLQIVADKKGGLRMALPKGQRSLLQVQADFSIAGVLANFEIWPTQTKNLGLLKPDTDLWLDNFEDSDTRTLLGPILTGGWWYADYSVGTASLTPSQIAQGIVQESTNTYLSVQATITNALYPQRYALVGMSLGGGERACTDTSIGTGICYFNINNTGGIAFKARGNGKVRVQLGVFGTYAASDYHFPYAEIQLTSTWQDFIIKPSDFKVDPGAVNTLSAAQLISHTYSLSFLLSDNTLFQLDDVRLKNTTLKQLSNK